MVQLQDIDSFLKLFQWADEQANGWLSISFIVGVFMTAFTLSLRFGKTRALIVASFFTTLISFFMSEAGLLDWTWFIVSAVALLVGLLLDSFKQ